MHRNRFCHIRAVALSVFALALLLLAGALGLWLRSAQRQYTLNRQLIAALVQGNDKQALALVNAGADPNTHYKPTPVPSLLQLVKQLLHRSASPVNDSPTALLIACGAWWNHEGRTILLDEQMNRPDAPQLVEAMLQHGANPNALCEHLTPLQWSNIHHDPNTMIVLVQHGADVNAKDGYGATVLKWAVFGSVVDKDLIRQLLVHGADPNLVDAMGETPLMIAQKYQGSDVVALLRHHGARK